LDRAAKKTFGWPTERLCDRLDRAADKHLAKSRRRRRRRWARSPSRAARRHTAWSARHKAFVWRILGEPLPVARLRPALPEEAARDRADGDRMREELLRRFKARVEEAYEQGYTDARTGKPPPSETP
jgi:hypothetical protein